MYEDLETNRSYWEMFSDRAKGERNKIEGENLVKNLKELKEALLTGISIYTKLLVQKEKFQKYFQNMKIINFESGGEVTQISNNSRINNVADHVPSEKAVRTVSYFEKSVKLSTAITMAVSCFFFQYKLLSLIFHVQNSTPEISMEWKEIAGSGVLCLGAGLVLIYEFVKCKEEKRTLKYQDIEKFQETLNAELLLEVKNKNEQMKEFMKQFMKLYTRRKLLYI